MRVKEQGDLLNKAAELWEVIYSLPESQHKKEAFEKLGNLTETLIDGDFRNV